MDDTLNDATNHVLVEDSPETPSSANVGSPTPSLQSQQLQYKKYLWMNPLYGITLKKGNWSTRRTLKLCAITAIGW
jgi:hypothetical protein